MSIANRVLMGVAALMLTAPFAPADAQYQGAPSHSGSYGAPEGSLLGGSVGGPAGVPGGVHVGGRSGTYTGGRHVPSGSPGADSKRTELVRTAVVGGWATVGGTVIPYREVELTAQIPGQVEEMYGQEGDAFEEGDVLARIDDDDIVAQRHAALAQMYQARTGLRNAHVQYSRELYSPRRSSPTTMPGMGMPSMFDQFFTRGMSNMAGTSAPYLERHADLHQSGSSIGQARGQVLAAQAQLRALDVKLKDAKVEAPFDGIIMHTYVEPGDNVQPGMRILKFANTEFLRVRAEVPVRLARGLTKNAKVNIKVDMSDYPVRARVARIYPMADELRHTITVKFDLPKGTPHAQPGMYAEVVVPDKDKRVQRRPVIPSTALVYRGSLPLVYIEEDGRVSLRAVRLGEEFPPGSGYRVVLSGLKGGETLYASPSRNFVPEKPKSKDEEE